MIASQKFLIYTLPTVDIATYKSTPALHTSLCLKDSTRFR